MLFWFVLAITMKSLGLPRQEKVISLKKLKVVGKAAPVFFVVITAGTLFILIVSYMADIQYLKSYTAINLDQKIGAGLRAIALNPLQSEYKINLSKLYLDRVSDELKKPSAQQDQNLITADVQKALAYARGGELQEKKIIGAVEVAPNRVAVWETLGVAYRDIQFAKGALDWGVKAFQKAVELEPANPIVRTELGKLYVVKEEFDLAKEEFDKAIALKSDYMPAYLQRALLYEKEGNSEAAILEMENLVVNNFSTEVLFQLGRLYYNRGNIEKAIEQFQRVIQMIPNHSNAHYSLGVAYEKQGKTIEARMEFERVLKLNPGNAVIRVKLDEL